MCTAPPGSGSAVTVTVTAINTNAWATRDASRAVPPAPA